MGIVLVKELSEKLVRIEKLKELGFNTPLMFPIPVNPNQEQIIELMKWATKTATNIERKNFKNKIFNIRTYRYFNDGSETFSQPHICDIKLDNLENEVRKYSRNYICLVDAEVPDNGRLAGNIFIERNPIGRAISFTIEYCEKPIRAMVRDANISITNSVTKAIDMKPELFEVFVRALMFKEKAILEWTWFKDLTGVKNHNIVWWEYRSI